MHYIYVFTNLCLHISIILSYDSCTLDEYKPWANINRGSLYLPLRCPNTSDIRLQYLIMIPMSGLPFLSYV